jgi:hypothetical protein
VFEQDPPNLVYGERMMMDVKMVRRYYDLGIDIVHVGARVRDNTIGSFLSLPEREGGFSEDTRARSVADDRVIMHTLRQGSARQQLQGRGSWCQQIDTGGDVPSCGLRVFSHQVLGGRQDIP